MAIGDVLILAYPVLKLARGRACEVPPLLYAMAILLVLYYLFVRSGIT